MDANSRIKELLEIVLSSYPKLSNSIQNNILPQEIQSNIAIYPVPIGLVTIYSYTINIHKELAEYDLPVIPGYYLIPLGKVNDYISIYKKVYEKYSGTENFLGFQPDMIPFLNDGFGYDICVRSLEGDQSLWVMPKGDQPWKINTSLDAFIETAIECYKQKAYYQERDDYNQSGDQEDASMVWEVDWELAQEIVKKTDPDLGYYRPPS
jgi:hypothetical protein